MPTPTLVSSHGAPTVVSAIPSQSVTAPINEHNCLYTYDVNRKRQKRWQDGFLRFHTFNKKCMLYDGSRNLIGGTHWQDDGAIQDGDEITIEGAGVMVSVAEKLRTEKAELGGLWEGRRERDKARMGLGLGGGSVRLRQGTLFPRNPNATPQTPSPLAARAVGMTISPFEERHARLAQEVGSSATESERRPSKRPRDDENHVPLWQLLRTSRPVNARQGDSRATAEGLMAGEPQREDDSIGRRPAVSDASKQLLARKKKQGRLRVTECVDLTGLSSQENSTCNGSPEREQLRQSNPPGWLLPPQNALRFNMNGAQTAAGRRHTSNERSAGSSKAVALQDVSNTTRPGLGTESTPKPALPASRAGPRLQQISLTNPSTPSLRTQPRIPLQAPSSPPVSTTNHLPSPREERNASHHVNGGAHDNLPVEQQQDQDDRPRKTKSLKVASRPQRKMLMCQNNDSTSVTEYNCRNPTTNERLGNGSKIDIPNKVTYGASREVVQKKKKKKKSGECIELEPIIVNSGPENRNEQESRNQMNRSTPAELHAESFPTLGHSYLHQTPITTSHMHLDAQLFGKSHVRPDTLEENHVEQPTSISKPPETSEPLCAGLDKGVAGATERNDLDRETLPRRSPLKRAFTDGWQSSAGQSMPVQQNPQEGSGNSRRNIGFTTRSLISGPVSLLEKKRGFQRSVTIHGIPDIPNDSQYDAISENHRENTGSTRTSVQDTLDHRMQLGMLRPTVQEDEEKGPWTREAFDLFGIEIARERREKTGKETHWLDQYVSKA